MKGKVLFWNVRRGWGFVAGDDRKDYFAHFRDIDNSSASYKVLQENELVEFDVLNTNKGLKAVKIRPLNCESVGVIGGKG